MMSNKEKRNLYRNGMYTCPTPKGDTTKWSVSDWIDYIDVNGKWK